jgi:hypothetical protein
MIFPSSCRGLKVLVDLLDEDYTEQAELIVHALNGIGSVFELQSPTTKNDFCRMFIREGLLDPLSAALLNVMSNRGATSIDMKMKIIQILLVFSQVTQSDIHVRNAMGTRKVVRRQLSFVILANPFESLTHLTHQDFFERVSFSSPTVLYRCLRLSNTYL